MGRMCLCVWFCLSITSHEQSPNKIRILVTKHIFVIIVVALSHSIFYVQEEENIHLACSRFVLRVVLSCLMYTIVLNSRCGRFSCCCCFVCISHTSTNPTCTIFVARWKHSFRLNSRTVQRMCTV